MKQFFIIFSAIAYYGCSQDINAGSLVSHYKCLSQKVIMNPHSDSPDTSVTYIHCSFNLLQDSTYSYSTNNIDWKDGYWNASPQLMFIDGDNQNALNYRLYKDCIPPSQITTGEILELTSYSPDSTYHFIDTYYKVKESN